MLVKCPSCKGTGEREATDEQTGNKYPTKRDGCDGSGMVYSGYINWLSARRKKRKQ